MHGASDKQPAQKRLSGPTNLGRRWLRLSSRHLPLKAKDSFWRYNRAARREEPAQGWKLHISATLLTACETLETVGPFLNRLDIQFKAPASLHEVNRINSGVHYGYSQIGKLITVYPQNDKQAVTLARELCRLTSRLTGPAVPFDYKFGRKGCVYYRYGAFRSLGTEDTVENNSISHLRHPQGHLIPDDRSSPSHPSWVNNPFPTQSGTDYQGKSPLAETYHAFRALAQRGRGGVYQAVDTSSNPPRLCILKEGRRFGEQSWDGRDGRWRIKHERQVIAALRKAGVDAPEIYSTFTARANYYLVTEFIPGESLMAQLSRRQRRLPIFQALELGAKIASVVAHIHAAGWTWRDCKPSNLILTTDGRLRPVDFEGACPRDKPDPMPWGTPGFIAPWRRVVKSREYEDLYAIGASLYLLLTGQLPKRKPVTADQLRRNIPLRATLLIDELLTADARRKPSASAVCELLMDTIKHGSGSSLNQPAG
jgi:hypothetical protein